MDIWAGHQNGEDGAGCKCPACSYVRNEIVAPATKASGVELPDPAFIPFIAEDLLQEVPGLAEVIARHAAEKN